jgi:hypothetical protein
MPDLPNGPGEKPHYRWPWFLLAAVVLFIALAIVWVSFAVKQVERERGTDAPVHAAGK